MKTLLIILTISLSSCRVYDYKIKLYDENTYIYSRKGKLVNVIPVGTDTILDNILLKDNL